MKSKFCSCGKIVPFNEICSCQKKDRNSYQRQYYQKNKDILKPLTSKRWRELRKVIINRDNGMCQRCFVKYNIINSRNLQVHHIKPRINFPHLIFEESNLITLCQTCNLQIGTSPELDFEPRTELENTDYDFKL